MDYHEEIKRLEEELRGTQYNKATEHHFGIVKAKIAKLRDAIEKRQASKKAGEGFFVRKSGDATAVLLGFPSVGKSTFLNKITNAESKVAAYEFTTLTVIPGVLNYNSAQIQVLDVPGILEGAGSGRGRGKEVLAMVRSSDLIIILIEALHPEHHPIILRELNHVGVRINQKKPDVKIVKKSRGGISIVSTVPLEMKKDTMERILREFRLNNCDIVIRTRINMDQFIDAIEGNKAYVPCITIVTKSDLADDSTIDKLKKEFKPNLFISAEQNKNIEESKRLIYNALSFVRIYLKEINKKPDLNVPLMLRKGATIKTVCERLHKDFIKKFKYVKIWGKTAKFPGQVLKDVNKELNDGDVVEIHLR